MQFDLEMDAAPQLGTHPGQHPGEPVESLPAKYDDIFPPDAVVALKSEDRMEDDRYKGATPVIDNSA
jgi:hypothetical protein